MKFDQGLYVVGLVLSVGTYWFFVGSYRYLRKRKGEARKPGLSPQTSPLTSNVGDVTEKVFPQLKGYDKTALDRSSETTKALHAGSIENQIAALGVVIAGSSLSPLALLFALLSSSSEFKPWAVQVFEGMSFGFVILLIHAHLTSSPLVDRWIVQRYRWLECLSLGWLTYMGLGDEHSTMVLFQEEVSKIEDDYKADELTLTTVTQVRIKNLFSALATASERADLSNKVNLADRDQWLSLSMTYLDYRIRAQIEQMRNSIGEQDALQKKFKKISRVFGWTALGVATLTIASRVWKADSSLESTRHLMEVFGLALVPLSLIVSAYPRANGWRENVNNYRMTYSALVLMERRFQRVIDEELGKAVDEQILGQAIRRMRALTAETELILHMEFRTWSVLHSKEVDFEA